MALEYIRAINAMGTSKSASEVKAAAKAYNAAHARWWPIRREFGSAATKIAHVEYLRTAGEYNDACQRARRERGEG